MLNTGRKSYCLSQNSPSLDVTSANAASALSTRDLYSSTQNSGVRADYLSNVLDGEKNAIDPLSHVSHKRYNSDGVSVHGKDEVNGSSVQLLNRAAATSHSVPLVVPRSPSRPAQSGQEPSEGHRSSDQRQTQSPSSGTTWIFDGKKASAYLDANPDIPTIRITPTEVSGPYDPSKMPFVDLSRLDRLPSKRLNWIGVPDRRGP